MNANTFLNELWFLVNENALLLAVGAFLILMIVWGYTRGMMTKLLSFCSVLVTLVIEMKLFPLILQMIRDNEQLHERFSAIGRSLLKASVEQVLETSAANGAEPIRFSFAESPIYHMLGLDVLAENTAVRIGNTAAAILCFVLIFILIRILVRFLMLVVRGLRKIHPIAWIDSLFGGVFGFAEGLLYVWIFMLVISGFPNVRVFQECLRQIAQDPLLTFLYRQNLIIQFIVSILK